MNFFICTWFERANPLLFQMIGADSAEKQQRKVDELVSIVNKEIEPLLEDANPYFGGRKEVTLAEVC